MNGPDWASTAIVLTRDDWEGFYDHVAPIHVGRANNLIETGMRTALIMISPYAKPTSVDHTQFSTVSIVKFVEDTFNLPALTGEEEMLNPSQTPLPARPCPATAVPISGANITPDD